MPVKEVGYAELCSDKVPHEQLNTLGNISSLLRRILNRAGYSQSYMGDRGNYNKHLPVKVRLGSS